MTRQEQRKWKFGAAGDGTLEGPRETEVLAAKAEPAAPQLKPAEPSPNSPGAAMDTDSTPVDTKESSSHVDAAAQKLLSELEEKQQSERDATATAADDRQREALGRKMHDTELANAIRDDPLGLDRRYNRYRWYGQLRGRESRLLPDRILFECGTTGDIRMLTHSEDMDAVKNMLDCRGARESVFARVLSCHEGAIRGGLAPRGRRGGAMPLELPPELHMWPEKERQDAQEAHFRWLLSIQTAGMTVLGEDGEVRATDYLPTDPPAVCKIKGELMCVESAIPEQAMLDRAWERVAWIRNAQVRCCTSSLPHSWLQ
jgi:hypothetical protein